MPDLASVTTTENIVQALILVTITIAVVTDMRQRRIFNKLMVPAMAVGVLVNTALNGTAGLRSATLGLLLGAAIFFIPVALGGMGAGDLKLLAALGALGGPGFVVWCAIYTAIVGGVFAVVALVMKRQLVSVVGGAALALYTHQMPRATSNIRLPYAIPIALGAVAALVFR